MITLLLIAAAKASVLLAAAFIVTMCMRRASAASRHLVWLAAFAGVVALPVVSVVLPAMRVPLLRSQALAAPIHEDYARAMALDAGRAQLASEVEMLNAQAARAQAELERIHAAGGRQTIAAPAPAVAFAPAADVAPAVAGGGTTWTMRVLLLWLFGFVMVAVAFAVGILRTHVLACAATPAEGDLLSEEAEILAAELGITRDVRVVTWQGPAMPMTWGALRPVVLLPEAARDWPAERRREVMMHELAHVGRGDWAARVLAAFVCALHWFNPLVWMGARRLRDEQELACDDVVLAGGAQPSEYAAHLLDVARSFRVPSVAAAHASVAMARPSQLSNRLLAMLDAGRRHTPASSTSRNLAWALMIMLALPVAAAVPVQRAAQEPKGGKFIPEGRKTPVAVGRARAAASADQAVAAGREATIAAAAAAPSADAAPAAIAIAQATSDQERCPERRGRSSGNRSTSSHSDDDSEPKVTTLSYSTGGCILEVRIVGNVRFRDDESDIDDLPRNGSVRVSEESGGVSRFFETRWRDGRLQRRFRLNDDDVPESDELREWLARAIQTTMARTGYNIVPRTLRAYRAGGLDSALRLTTNLSSDYSKRMALMALLDSVRVPPAEAARVARVSETMSSDYERAELLIAVAGRLRLDGPVQEAMVASSSTMSSDYERRRVLTAALARGDLSNVAMQGLLRSAAQMSSDYEKVELLLTFLRARAFDESRRAALFTAANSLSSDYERRRLLSEIVTTIEAPGQVLGEVTASSAQMSSDYERAELLVQIMRKFGGNPAARSQVLRATEGMSSDHEKNRVLALLARQ